ncbi:MAG: PEP-CTERM sorting domain-containing protein [Rubrivivax sp.]|nr:PEP-CTERM sorting domain-containing protein [Rubrivivax sp.]
MRNRRLARVHRWGRWRAVAAGAALLAAGPALAQRAQSGWLLEGFGEYNSVAVGISSNGILAVRSDTGGALLNPDGSVTRLGTYQGQNVYVSGVNALGQVAGHVLDNQGGVTGLRWQGGAFTVLDPTGQLAFIPSAINDQGTIVGTDYSQAGTRAMVWSDGTLRDVGLAASQATAISPSGLVAGTFPDAGGVLRPFVFNGTFSTIAPTPGQASVGGVFGVNDRGDVAGHYISGADLPFLSVGGQAVALGHPDRGSGYALGLNADGLAVGRWDHPDFSTRAVLYAQGRVIDLNTVNGVAGSGWTLTAASAINDLGQMAVQMGDGIATSQAGRLTLSDNVWEGAVGGHWDDAAGWSHGVMPNRLAHVWLDPTRSLTVLGPAGRAEVRRLTIGTGASGGGGIATLQLNGGTLAAVGDSPNNVNGFQGVLIGRNGVLTGDGVISVESQAVGGVFNQGTVLADNVRITGSNLINGTLYNHGLIAGQATGPARIVSSYLFNETDGRIRVLAGERLTLEAAFANYGSVEVLGGRFTHRGGGEMSVLSTAGVPGRVLAQDALFTFETGLLVAGGQFAFSGGTSNVFGAITVQRSALDNRGGQLIVSGNSRVAFYDGLDVQSGGELRVAAGSVASFFGLVRQRTGALFTGTGTKFYEGGLAIGNSPGIGTDEGDVSFGGGNVYFAEIGGTGPGTGHDQLIVGGHLSFGGTLKLESWLGYTGAIGERYDLFDWGSAEGQFDFIDAGGLLLADGAVLDTSRLYVDGSVGIAAVPEPGTWALWLAGGVSILGLARRRRTRVP